AASGSEALQTEVAARLWTQAGDDLAGQAAALMATGGSVPAIQRLIDTAGVDALAQSLGALCAEARSGSEYNLLSNAATSAAGLGNLMSALARMPRSETTDRLATTLFLGLPSGLVQSNDAVRVPVAEYLASIRFPGNDAAQQADAGTWDAILQSHYGSELLFNPALPVEARQANLMFFLQRPNFDAALLDTYQGNMGSIAAAEVQRALGTMDPGSVNAAAELPPVPAALAGRFPAIANLPQPVTAEGLQGSIPNPITPTMAADYLEALAASVAATGNTNLTTYTDGNPALAALFQVIAGNPIQQANLDDFSAIGVTGLRDLARQIRGSSDPAFVAQALTLGGIQHDAYFDNLQPFVDSVIAQQGQVLGNIASVRQLAQGVVKMGVGAMAMAAGGPAAAALANASVGAIFAQSDAWLDEGRTLALPNLVNGAVMDFGVGVVAPWLGGKLSTALGPLAGKILEGSFEALGGQVANAMRDPEKFEELWDSGQGKEDLVIALILGSATNAVPWNKFSDRLKTEIVTFMNVKWNQVKLLDDALKNSAMVATSFWLDPNIQAKLRSGELTPAQAVLQMEEEGIDLFGMDTASADPALTEAMLRVLLSSPALP
ncbi:hypothetical protein ACLESD_28550, partial [Pyxidicoccus sp. 3LFB2]